MWFKKKHEHDWYQNVQWTDGIGTVAIWYDCKCGLVEVCYIKRIGYGAMRKESEEFFNHVFEACGQTVKYVGAMAGKGLSDAL